MTINEQWCDNIFSIHRDMLALLRNQAPSQENPVPALVAKAEEEIKRLSENNVDTITWPPMLLELIGATSEQQQAADREQQKLWEKGVQGRFDHHKHVYFSTDNHTAGITICLSHEAPPIMVSFHVKQGPPREESIALVESITHAVCMAGLSSMLSEERTKLNVADRTLNTLGSVLDRQAMLLNYQCNRAQDRLVELSEGIHSDTSKVKLELDVLQEEIKQLSFLALHAISLGNLHDSQVSASPNTVLNGVIKMLNLYSGAAFESDLSIPAPPLPLLQETAAFLLDRALFHYIPSEPAVGSRYKIQVTTTSEGLLLHGGKPTLACLDEEADETHHRDGRLGLAKIIWKNQVQGKTTPKDGGVLLTWRQPG